jgi:hypothetical protein
MVTSLPSFLTGSPFFQFQWVFYADLLIGGLLGMAGAQLRYRVAPEARRKRTVWWGALVGALAGATVFLPVLYISHVMGMLSPPGPLAVFVMSLIVLAILVLWIGNVFRRRKGPKARFDEMLR